MCARVYVIARTRNEDRNGEEDYDKLRLDKWPFI